MSKLNSLLESAGSNWKNMQSDAAKLANKWSKTGLLEGLEGETHKNNMALLLENQAKQLVVESSQTGGGTASSAGFTAGNGEQWMGVALPLVRKVFGQISTKEFLSVQPMNLPSGLVFYLDFQYGNSKAPFTAGGSLFGNRTDADNPFSTPDTEGGLYGAGRFAYTTNATSSVETASTGSATWKDFNFDSAFSASFGEYSTVTVDLAGTNADFKAVRSFNLKSGSADLSILPAFTTLTGTNVTFVVTGSEVIETTPEVTVEFSLQPTDTNRGDFEDNNPALNEDNSPAIDIPEINIQMVSEPIVAKTKKLKAVWTPEFAQDLNAYQSLDAEAELSNVMSEYISLEIDLEMLDMLIQDAGAGTEYWSARNNRVINNDTTGFDVDASGFLNTQGQWFQTLGTKLQKLSNRIHQLTLRGGANWMVVSPSVATILESIPGYASSSDGDVTKASYAFGVQKAGQLNNRFTVYKNPYMTENLILMGFRGTQFLEAGAVFAPYIPLIMTPLLYDPETFTPRKGLLTRYAKKMLRPEFFGKVYVEGLNTL